MLQCSISYQMYFKNQKSELKKYHIQNHTTFRIILQGVSGQIGRNFRKFDLVHPVELGTTFDSVYKELLKMYK